MVRSVTAILARLLTLLQPATSLTMPGWFSFCIYHSASIRLHHRDIVQLHAETCGTEKQTAGYIDQPNRADTHYFYWYFESRSKPSTDPLIVWIPGGPGEGGTYGLLGENGPCTVNDDLSTKVNPHSWTAVANVVWVDLPGNAGFSYSTTAEDDESTDERVDESIFWFLQEFLKKHPELQGRALFLVGESYGGHFVSSAAHFILAKQRESVSAESIAINLQGIAIGNGLVDPVEVFTHFVNMTSNVYNITLVGEPQLAAMESALAHCRDLMTRCQSNTSMCGVAGLYCQQTQLLPLLRAHRNPYDIRQKCQTSLSNATKCMLKVPKIKAYLDLPKVREFLGVHPSRTEWILLNRTINAAFFSAPSFSGYLSMGGKLANLLNSGLRVLLYAGDADILCNIYATEATAKKLKWSGATNFNSAPERAYTTSSGFGILQSYSHLTFVKVHNAGHAVPGDQPELALDMITKFVHNETF